jgi:hypothetical protein
LCVKPGNGNASGVKGLRQRLLWRCTSSNRSKGLPALRPSLLLANTLILCATFNFYQHLALGQYIVSYAALKEPT